MAVLYYITNHGYKNIRQCFLLHQRFSSNYHNTQSSLTYCKQLFKIKEDPLWYKDYRILDVTWDLDERDYSVDHFSNRIPASKYFDLEECRDKNSPYKMMLPSPEQFEDYVSELGISNNHHVVIYDNHVKYAMFSSPRLWWMFRVFGHDNVSVLNGGLKCWMQEGYDTVSGNYTEEENLPKPAQKFKATFRPNLVRDFEFVKENGKKTDPVPLLESRVSSSLASKYVVEDLSDISVPCATWTPFDKLLDKERRSIRPANEIEEFFSSRNIDLDNEPVTTCGRGVSASVVSFCVYYATGKNVPVYDGSWYEWKNRSSLQN